MHRIKLAESISNTENEVKGDINEDIIVGSSIPTRDKVITS